MAEMTAEIGSVAYEGLMNAVGSPAFSAVLLQIADAQVGADEVFGYWCEDAAQPIQIASWGRSGSAATRASLYTDRFHAFDPLLPLVNTCSEGGPTRSRRVMARDIVNPAYRRECYERPGLGEKLSYVMARAQRRYVLNFYRGRGRTAASTKGLAALADMALPMLRKQAELHGHQPQPPLLQRVSVRLEAAYPELTQRERQVCARTLIGMTAEAIGLDLDITISTVVTYRRRAYARFGLSNANQLMSGLLS